MMPNVAGAQATRKQMFIYSLALAPMGVAPTVSGSASILYGIFATILGAVFILKAWKVFNKKSNEQSLIMEKRLFIIMTIGAALTIIFTLILIYVITGIERQVWFQMKFILIIGLIFFHLKCWCWIKKLRDGFITKNTNKLRLFNEIPVFFLISIVILAILKPF